MARVFFTAGVLSMHVLMASVGLAQKHASGHVHHHGAGHSPAKPVEAPKIFLDKSPRIVAYQLQRLSNERLLMVERKPDDPKYVPVYQAILARDGMSPQYRGEAVEALVRLSDSDAVSVLLGILGDLNTEKRQMRRTAGELADMLLRLPQQQLQSHLQSISAATDAKQPLLRSTAYAAMITAGESDAAWAKASDSKAGRLDWLKAVQLVPEANARNGLRKPIVSLIKTSESPEVQRAAIEALAFVPAQQAANIQLIAPLVANAELREAAVRTLLEIPAEFQDRQTSETLAGTLVAYAESTPPADRTSDEFVDAMQLVDRVLVNVPVDQAKDYRQRLSAVTVRVVRIETVEEEMRYDVAYFAVEAGRPVQVILDNHDLMPHNLVVTQPGELKAVAELGLKAGPEGGWEGKQYVPRSDKVLHATHMVQPNQQQRLTFTAPSQPGEYPYVCTFPQHWYRMYGVMVVVEDLEEWLRNPTEPADPIGNNRSFVRSWSVDDLKDKLPEGLRGRSMEIGKRLFAEASCLSCHKVGDEGGAIGPELTDVYTRWKGDDVAVLREILDPSHRIDEKYAMHLVLTVDGQTMSGIVVAEDKDSVSILANAEAKEPTVIALDDIEEMVKTSTSMMPRALLDQYTQDEIFELLAYLKASAG